VPLGKNDLEKAVQCLLCPRNYEYILFVQSQVEKNPAYLTVLKEKQAKNVVTLISQAKGPGRTLQPDEAIHVLREAIRRIK